MRSEGLFCGETLEVGLKGRLTIETNALQVYLGNDPLPLDMSSNHIKFGTNVTKCAFLN